MYGLAVRWAITPQAGAASTREVEEQLRDYVTGPSLIRFTGLPGLRFKTWRLRPGEWFEGTYVFATERARDDFRTGFTEQAPTAPGSQLLGAPPILIETFEVVAVAEGAEGFAPGPGPGLG